MKNPQLVFKALESKMKAVKLSAEVENRVTHEDLRRFKEETIAELTDMVQKFDARLEATKMSSMEWKEYFSSLKN